MRCGIRWRMKTRSLSSAFSAPSHLARILRVSGLFHQFAFVGIGLGLLSGAAAAEDTPSPVLNFALQSYGTQKYVGVRTVTFRRDGTDKNRTEFVTVDGQKSRTEFPPDSSEAGQIVVETPDERREFFPTQNIIRISGGRENELTRMANFLRRMGDRVRVKETGARIVVGRRGHEVSMSDPDGNVRQRLVVDDATGLVLKRELFDSVGTVVARFEFSRLDFKDRIDSRLFRLARKGAKVVRPIDDLRSTIAGTPFVLAEFPPEAGFKLEFSRILNPPEGKVLLQLYKGDEGRVSLFQTLAEVAPGQLRRFGREEVKTLSWRDKDRYFALVGNVPSATLERLKRLIVITP